VFLCNYINITNFYFNEKKLIFIYKVKYSYTNTQLSTVNNLLTMAPTKMPCKNNSAFMYSGKESSPMGLGYCPDSEALGKEMVGKDGMMWVVRAPKGIKMWSRVTAEEKKLVREPPVLVNTDDTNDNGDKADNSDLEDPFGWKPTENDDIIEKPTEEKVKPAQKKRGPAAKEDKVNDVVVDDVKAEPKKRGRPPKAKKNDNEEPKKERKPRAKTEYNEFLSSKMKELREKHKDDSEKLKTTEYLKMAIAEWKLYKETKNTVVA